MDLELCMFMAFLTLPGLALFGLRLVIRNLKRSCEETQAEIRRLVSLFEPGTDQGNVQAN